MHFAVPSAFQIHLLMIWHRQRIALLDRKAEHSMPEGDGSNMKRSGIVPQGFMDGSYVEIRSARVSSKVVVRHET